MENLIEITYLALERFDGGVDMLMLLEARRSGERFAAFSARMRALKHVLRTDVTLQVRRISEVFVTLITTELHGDEEKKEEK